MDKVYNLKDAKRWVKNHPNENLICSKNKIEKEVINFEEARIFYQGQCDRLPNDLIISIEKMEDDFNKILKLESEIEKSKKVLTVMQNPNAISQITLSGLNEEMLNKAIELKKWEIEQNRNSIQRILKAHPELEPHWILHQITK